MSQEKMDRYKAAKANKEEIRKKQKRDKFVVRLIWTITIVIVIGLIALGIYISIPKKSASPETTQESNIEDYLNSIQTETSEETPESAAASETSAATEENDSETTAESASTEESASETTAESASTEESASETTVESAATE